MFTEHRTIPTELNRLHKQNVILMVSLRLEITGIKITVETIKMPLES